MSLVGSAMAEPPEEGPESLANEPPITKPEERAKFHAETVRGTSAGERLRAWERTVDLRKASYFEGVKWRNVGPEVQGGRVIDIAAPTAARTATRRVCAPPRSAKAFIISLLCSRFRANANTKLPPKKNGGLGEYTH